MKRLELFALFVALLAWACTSVRTVEVPSNTGVMTLALSSAGPDGKTYRLRGGLIDIAGPTATTIDTESDVTAAVRSVQAAPGNYQITLADGWHLERVESDGAVAVNATFSSPVPIEAHVSPSGVTHVSLSFMVQGLGDVVLDPGRIDVSIQVGEHVCAPVAQSDCSSGQKCTSFQGNARCAPDGNIAEGAACTSEDGLDDCVKGTQCSGGVCKRICRTDSASTNCSCIRSAGLFSDHENVGLCEPACDLAMQNCPAGDACYPSNNNFTGMCATTGNLPPGAACQYVNACQPGSACLLQYADRTQPECAQLCNAGTGQGCPGSLRCLEIGSPDASATIGACVDCARMPEACN